MFGNRALLSKLNYATHLPITVELFRQILCSFLSMRPVVVLDCPLLFEAKLQWLCSTTVCVSCDAEDQVKRQCERDGCDEDHARKRIESQMPLEQKRRLADVVIDSTGTRQECVQRARAVARSYKKKGFLAWAYR